MMTLIIQESVFYYNHPVSVYNTYLALTAFHWKKEHSYQNTTILYFQTFVIFNTIISWVPPKN